MKKYKIINGTFCKDEKIDNHMIGFEYCNQSFIKIWYCYNSNMDQTFLYYDLKEKNFTKNVDRIFTARQKKILLKKLEAFSKDIILHYINIINDRHFTWTDHDLQFLETLKNKLCII